MKKYFQENERVFLMKVCLVKEDLCMHTMTAEKNQQHFIQHIQLLEKYLRYYNKIQLPVWFMEDEVVAKVFHLLYIMITFVSISLMPNHNRSIKIYVLLPMIKLYTGSIDSADTHEQVTSKFLWQVKEAWLRFNLRQFATYDEVVQFIYGKHRNKDYFHKLFTQLDEFYRSKEIELFIIFDQINGLAAQMRDKKYEKKYKDSIMNKDLEIGQYFMSIFKEKIIFGKNSQIGQLLNQQILKSEGLIGKLKDASSKYKLHQRLLQEAEQIIFQPKSLSEILKELQYKLQQKEVSIQDKEDFRRIIQQQFKENNMREPYINRLFRKATESFVNFDQKIIPSAHYISLQLQEARKQDIFTSYEAIQQVQNSIKSIIEKIDNRSYADFKRVFQSFSIKSKQIKKFKIKKNSKNKGRKRNINITKQICGLISQRFRKQIDQTQ